ncbi:MAG: amidohydrolase family protein, partial [Candidatus Heimdallarchaeota archaeon]|nr:amidohydrolase family protein [Candidatus Heimdallarchaeota archaeon]
HMAGQPEHLDNLGRWLDKYPNLYVDTASAKWMARAFSQQKEKAKKFFIKYSNRVLFGTDMVSGRTDREPLPNYYYNRYLTFQALWETAVEGLKMPIPDPENNNETKINGLDLPLNVLKKLYWENGKQLFKF